MLRNHGIKLLIVALMSTILGCAAGISQQALSQVTYTGTFAQLQAQPQRYQGEVVLAGGKIIETLVGGSATEIIVLQLPLDRRDEPVDNDRSRGRFIVRSGQFLDPAVYSKGTLVTVVGRVISAEKRPIGQMDYLYPVLEPVELKKWERTDLRGPRFHFGVGVGTTF